MAGGRRKKCKICGEWIEVTEEAIPYSSGSVRGWAHKRCFDIEMKTLLSKKKERLDDGKKAVSCKRPQSKQKELKEGLSDEEYKQKQELCDYIRSLLQQDNLSAKIYTLIDYYRKKFKVTYSDILYTLYWYYELCENSVEDDAIGIFPYQYEKAMKYAQSIKVAKEANQSIADISALYRNKTVQISPARDSQKGLIDISELGRGDGESE